MSHYRYYPSVLDLDHPRPPKALVFLHGNVVPDADELENIDHRCTLSEIQEIKKLVKSAVWSRRILVFLACLVLLIGGIAAIDIIPAHISPINKEYLIGFLVLFLIFGSFLILRNAPILTRNSFDKINAQLNSKQLALVVPTYKEKLYKKDYFEIWRIEGLKQFAHTKYGMAFKTIEITGTHREENQRNHPEAGELHEKAGIMGTESLREKNSKIHQFTLLETHHQTINSQGGVVDQDDIMIVSDGKDYGEKILAKKQGSKMEESIIHEMA